MAERQDLKARTKAFALDVARKIDELPKSLASDILAKLLLRCATAVGANYRAACRAQTKAVFLAKLAVVIEESDECMYWLELLHELGKLPEEVFQRLHHEADELTAIFVASRKTGLSNAQKKPG